jgi:hypothetical protein
MMPKAEYDAKILAVVRYYEPLIIEAASHRDFDEFDRLKQSERAACEQVRAESFGQIE